MSIINLFIFFIPIINLAGSVTNQTCSSDPNKYYYKDQYFDLFKNFDAFDDLILDCNRTYSTDRFIEFNPRQPIIIDSAFNLNRLISFPNLKKLYTLCMIYFKGIDINTHRILVKVDFYFTSSKLDFYINNSLITKKECIMENFESFDNSRTFFSNFGSIAFIGVSYKHPVCPFVFLNSNLYTVYFTDIANSFLNKNVLNFIDVNETNISMIFIKNLMLDIKYDVLSFNIMNRYLFQNLERIKIYGCLIDINEELFKHFDSIKKLDFVLDNLREFFEMGNRWMSYLNNNVKVNLSDIDDVNNNLMKKFKIRFSYRLNTSLINKIYDYPDEHFCLFKDFPHDHMVIPLILPGKKINCSCTVLWLVQYYSHYFDVDYRADYNPYINYEYSISDEYMVRLDGSITYCHDNLFNESIRMCDFTRRLKLCNTSLFNYDQSFKLNNDTDFLFLIKWLQFILIIIMQPILTVIGIVNNLIIILVIRNKKTKKYFKDVMYKHIIINCVFNIIFCVIMIFELINECVFYNSSVFCSKLYQYESSQYFKIIFIYYFGNVVKLCKNISFLAFTFSRFILSLNKKNGFFKIFNKMNMKLYVFLMALFSSLFSIFKLFQYTVVDNFDPTFDFPFESFNEVVCQKTNKSYKCDIFSTLKIINNIINNILIYLLNFIIDILLMKGYSSHMAKRRQILNISTQNSHHQTHDESKEKENRVSRMVLISNILYLFSNLPEFISSVLVILFSKQISLFESFYLSSDLLVEESQFFALLSIVLNFFILVLFNKNFRKSFLILTKLN